MKFFPYKFFSCMNFSNLVDCDVTTCNQLAMNYNKYSVVRL